MRENSYTTLKFRSTPDIVSVISQHVQLRPAGRELVGLCPMHADRNPSLRVSEQKQQWYCFACGIGGDVLAFVMRHDGLTFPQALAELGMGGTRPPGRSRYLNNAAWARAQVEKMNLRLRELDEEIEWADEIPDPKLAESLWRERRLLATVRDDLRDPAFRQDFAEIRDVIEGITKGFA